MRIHFRDLFPAIGKDCTAEVQTCIDRCAAQGGGTVVLSAGQYNSGALWLKSDITLELEAGAVLTGIASLEAFPECISEWEGPKIKSRGALINGEGLSNVAIVGRGTIDGNGQFWWDQQADLDDGLRLNRPRIIRLVNCTNVLIDGLTLRNAAAWTLNPVACENVTVTRLTISNPPDSPNTDGINPDSCRNVRISDCHIDVGDDCITIKSGTEEQPRREYRPCENITITNCTMMRGHGGVVIGSEMSGGVRNVAISNCTFIGTDRGIRIKSRRGRGGVVEDVRVSNLVMENVLCPVALNLFYGCGAWGMSKVTDKSAQPVDSGTPRFRRLRFSNISAYGVKFSSIFILGLPEMFVEDVCFDNMSVWLDTHNTIAGDSDMAPDLEPLCRAGAVIKNVRQLKLRNIDIHGHLGSAIRIDRSDDVDVVGVSSTTQSAADSLIQLEDVRQASIHSCRLPARTHRLIRVSGEESEAIFIGPNTVPGSGQAVELDASAPMDAVQQPLEQPQL